ncbi:MAG: hypothetical protein AB7O39_00980 [Flavobacteriaceae bacterium]
MTNRVQPHLPRLREVLGEYLKRHKTHGHPVSVRSAMSYVRQSWPDCGLSEQDLSVAIEEDAIANGYNLRLDAHRDHR